MSDRESTQRWVVLWAWFSVLVVYGLTLHGMPRHVFWSPDEGGKFLQAKTMHFGPGIDYVLPYPGKRLDPELRFYAFRPDGQLRRTLYPVQVDKGRFHFHWPIWFPVLSGLPLAVFGITGLYILPLLAGWLTAILSGRLAAEIDSSLEVPAVLVVGLASPIYFYSLCFWEHTLAAALGVFGVLLFARGRGSLRALLCCLPVLVAAALLRLEMLALVLAVVAAWAVCATRLRRGAADGGPTEEGRLRRWAPVLLLGLTIALLIVFALAIPDRQASKLMRLPQSFERLLEHPSALLQVLINSPRTYGPSLASAELAVVAAAVVFCAAAPFVRWVKLEGAMTLAGVSALLLVVTILVFEPDYRCLHGLIPIAPYVILAPYAVPPAWRQRHSPFFVLATVGVLYFIAGTAAVLTNPIHPSGNLKQGLQWGPRYLLGLYPFLAVMGIAGVYHYWQSPRPRPQRAIVVVLFGLLIGAGFLFQQRGISQAVETRRTLAAWQAAIEGHAPIVTELWWFPASLAEFYAREPVYVVRSERHARDWSRLAKAGGVDRFTFFTRSALQPGDSRFPGFALEPGSSRVVSGAYVNEFTSAADQ